MRTHLRITDGNASCASASIGRWKPSASIRSTRAANRSMVSSKCVKPCRTCPADCQATAIGASASASVARPWRRAPLGARQFGHAAEQTLARAVVAAARCPRRPPARNARHAAAAAAASAPAAAVRAAMPARRPAQCGIHGHSTQAGAAGVQTVAPRSNSAWAKSDGCAIAAGSLPSCAARPRSTRLGCRQPFLHREQPRHHALDIAVHRHRRQTERDRADRRCGVVADARQRPQPGQVTREAAGGNHRLRAGVQVAGARVVAEAGPGSEHRLQRRGSQRFDAGKAA